MNRRDLLLLLIRLLLLLLFLYPLSVVNRLRVHDFELFFKARFRYFFLLELSLKRSDVIKRYHAATIHILLAGLPEMIVILLPEYFFLLTLLQFLPSFLEVVDEEPALVDEDIDDLTQLFGVSLAQIGKKRLGLVLLLLHPAFIIKNINELQSQPHFPTPNIVNPPRPLPYPMFYLKGQYGGVLLFVLILLKMEREEEQTLSTPGVIEKYQISAKIANEVLTRLIKKVAVGSKIFELCLWSDGQIYEELSKVYNKKPVFKGLAFPTTISVNEVCGYNAPLQEDSTTIKEGDLVKIELGVHIDGFAGFVAHTIVVQSDKNAPITGKKADVILAAYKAAQAAVRLLKPGHINNEVTEVIQKVCNAYQVNPLEGVLSHELKKHLIDGNKVIINKETFEQRVDPQEFAVHDVFALDVFVSSGEGKPKESDMRCTVYKRALDRTYALKIKQSRQFFNDVLDRYPSFCFGLNSFEDPIAARIGIKECLEHELLVPFPILVEKPGNYVAQFKFTVMITKGKTTALTGLPIDESQFKTENELKDQTVLDLLALSMDKAEQKKAKKQQVKQ